MERSLQHGNSKITFSQKIVNYNLTCVQVLLRKEVPSFGNTNPTVVNDT